MDIETSKQINIILNENKIDDLKKFINKRACLNNANNILIYIFYLFQTSGVLISSIATSSNNISLIWIGIGLNMIASIIHIYEKINNNFLKKLLIDIQNIKNGNYVDESEILNLDTINNKNTNKNIEDV
jgi:hypothetical protein